MAKATGARRVVVATAGHVDHGKTALMKALTGVDTDRLPDERRRGISLDLGFAELEGTGLSFIDVPGHRRLVHTMIAGVGGVDAALLVVAADDGVMPQTREHLHVCALLGIERVVVAIAKADLVDDETIQLAESDVRSTLQDMRIEPLDVVITSAVTGRGITELAEALRRGAADTPKRTDSARLWLPVDRAFTIKGAGTVVTGTLTRGRLAVGDAVYVAGPDGTREATCRAIEVHGTGVRCVGAPSRVAVNLTRLEPGGIRRGNVLTFDAELPRPTRIDVSFRALPGTDKLLKERATVILHGGTTRTTARMGPVDDGIARINLEAPIPLEGGVGIVLRGFSDSRDRGAVLGGGHVLDADAPVLGGRRRSRSRLRSDFLSAVRRADLGTALPTAIELAAPHPLDAAGIERRLGLEPGTAARELGRTTSGAIPLSGGARWTTRRIVDRLRSEVVGMVTAHHEAHPYDAGLSAETVRAVAASRAGRELAELALTRAAECGEVVVEGSVVIAKGFVEASRTASERMMGRLRAALAKASLTGASDAELAAAADGTPESVRAGLSRLAGSGEARRLGGMWFAERALDELREEVTKHLRSSSSMSVATFKALAGVSRKQAIPLLEQLDREGTTRRQGDLRVLGSAAKV